MTNVTKAVWSQPNPQPGVVYVYRVAARDGEGNVLATSTPDAAMLASFSDDPLGNSTRIQAAHLAELVSAINTFRAAAGLANVTLSGMSSGSLIRASHIAQLRTAIAEARAAMGITAVVFEDEQLATGITPVRMRHLQQLRDAVR